MALLAMFPMLFIFMLWAGGFIAMAMETSQQYGAINYDISTNTAHALVTEFGFYVLVGVAVWFAVAYFFNQRMINKSTGAHSLDRKDAPEVYDLLENLCISRGIKTPHLFIIESEGLNAYASGINEKTYSVTLTRGLIAKLNKEELEGVIAHELTHILNRDVRLLIVSIIFVGIISFLAQLLFRNMFYSRRRSNSKDGGKLIIVAFIVLAIGYVFAILIRFAMSRRREYMADAGAVELTKNPNALASALAKISGHAEIEGSSGEIKQMFIENPPMFNFMHSGFFSIFSTHPPINKRIEFLKRMA
jgi:heat shock protein HtpX